MNRKFILEYYKVNELNVIVSPGKFESEMIYVPYFWDCYLNGFWDDDDNGVITFEVNDNDIKEFPELIGKDYVKLTESDNGFVIEV